MGYDPRFRIPQKNFMKMTSADVLHNKTDTMDYRKTMDQKKMETVDPVAGKAHKLATEIRLMTTINASYNNQIKTS